MSTKDILLEPIAKNNPIALQILGICSALAVIQHEGGLCDVFGADNS